MSRIRILLAEDDADHQWLLVRCLTSGRPHVEVVTVSNGRDLLHEFSQSHYDCVVLDFNLPDCDADELLGALQESRAGCPIIVVSSGDAQEVVIRSLRGGSMDFVPKIDAVTEDSLWQRVEVALTTARRRREREHTLQHRLRRLTELAEKDALTGLLNRLGLETQLGRCRRATDDDDPVAVLMLDIDHFKQINDRYGHATGDMILEAAGVIIRNSLRRQDLACRWGGEEILIVLSAAGLGPAVLWAERLRSRIERHQVAARGGPVAATVSIGVACVPRRRVLDYGVRQADRALYLAKARGRNHVCTWQMSIVEDMLQQVESRMGLSTVDRLGEFLLRCEPVLELTQREHLVHHSRRVSELAMHLGEILAPGSSAVLGLELAGLGHDLAKALVPEDILAKSTPLTPDEHRIVDRCRLQSLEALIRLGAPADVLAAVQYAPARYDGAGEDGMAHGPSLPFGARVLAVADAMDAMVSGRPYRVPRTLRGSAWELLRERGRQFDPVVVDAACDHMLQVHPR